MLAAALLMHHLQLATSRCDNFGFFGSTRVLGLRAGPAILTGT
jgi:hypothetical protein